MAKAKMAVVLGDYDIEVREYEIPKALPGSLVIKVEAACICGSDNHYMHCGVSAPGAIGHEFAGHIVDIGEGAEKSIHCYGGELKLGDRIAVYPWITCGTCPSCMRFGNGVCIMCDDAFIYGDPRNHTPGIRNCDPETAPHFKGGFGEYVHIYPGTYVWKIPDEMPSKIAALMDPTAVAMRAIEQAMTAMGGLHEGISTTTTALIIGAGPIGVIAGMILRHMGVERLLISDMNENKLKMAQDICGADEIINVGGLTTEERVAKVREMTNGGPDVVINCANHVSSSVEGLQMVGKLGTFVEVGNAMSLTGAKNVTIDLPRVVFERNATVTSVVANYPKTFDRAFRLLKRYKEIPFERLLTHPFYSLDDLLPTLKKMRDDDYLKGVLIFKD